MSTPGIAVVIPTIGRPSLATLLLSLAASCADGDAPSEVIIVDDRRSPAGALDLSNGRDLPLHLTASHGHGPAAARNAGWRRATAPWVAFLDDDVVVSPTWFASLAKDLSALPGTVAGSQGRISVPLPVDRRPTDWERNVASLERARWATADLTYRRDVLEEVGGFDERFPRAYREDADIGLRIVAAGYRIVRGDRCVTHPVGAADWKISVRRQVGNADDVLMWAIHGPSWRADCDAGPSRNWRHLSTTLAGASALAALLARRHRLAVVSAMLCGAGITELAAARIVPGPRSSREVLSMLLTSAAIPPVATWWRIRALAGLPRAARDDARAPLCHGRIHWSATVNGFVARRRFRKQYSGMTKETSPTRAILFDRDGTLVIDQAGTAGSDHLVPIPGARAALAAARAAGCAIGVVSNQSRIGRGLTTSAEVRLANKELEEVLGPIDTWQVCPHAPDQGCGCRKPEPGLVTAAARALGVDTASCVVIGDIGSDVAAGAAAGSRTVLVPAAATRLREIFAAPVVAPDLRSAVRLALGAKS